MTTESGGRSALTATAAPSLAEALLQVRDRRRQLLLGPVLADRRHLPRPVADHVPETLGVLQQRARRDVRADAALGREAVAFGAHAFERFPPERGPVVDAALYPRLVLGGRQHLDLRQHRGVLDAAELGTLAAEGSELRGAEGRVVGLARDRVELAAERRNPPAVSDVAADDPQADGAVVRHAQVVDRDRPVRVDELPVELVRVHGGLLPRLRLLVGQARGGADVAHLPEDEARDDREDHDRARRPGELEVRVAAHLGPLDLPRPAAAAVADDEQQQQPGDEHEDPGRHGEDQPIDIADVRRVRRGRRRRSEASVPGKCGRCRHQREQRSAAEDSDEAAHRRWHSMNVPERTRVELPAGVSDAFEVFVNGILQQPGRDYRREGGELVFERRLAREGRLGFWRWLSLFLGVAGTYRQNDSVDVVYEIGGRRIVATALPLRLET